MHLTTRHNSPSNSHLSFQTGNLKLQDKTAFDSLYDKYAPAIYGVLLDWMKQESVAQVILQKTFQAYASESSTGELIAKPFICLLRIARKEYGIYLEKQDSLLQNPLKEYSSSY
jgi:hypothetical protein